MMIITNILEIITLPFKIRKLLEKLDELIDNNNLQFVEHNVQETLKMIVFL